jgi:uncharacterized membrane protein YphA (DoxX/SURF4 family)
MSAENPLPPASDRWGAVDFLAVLARLFLGAVFLYMGLNKALHPVEFLKLLRQYDLLPQPLWLNLAAASLPWFEIFCGLFLLLGIAVRGTAAIAIAMLVPFTVAVILRALALRNAGGLPFCAIKFDCGCGAGEVFVCRKLAENILLTAISAWLVFWPRHRLSLRSTLV